MQRFGFARRGRWFVMLLFLMATGGGYASQPQKADVRVLIDISGSMVQNDPQNLRRPALRMLAGLLQPGTRAGIWTFGRWVNNLVPVTDVDAAWKDKIRSVSNQIKSPGQFTNIELVLEKASADWSGEPQAYARHLVLLTDGMVDVSKDAAESAASRERIIATLLPALKDLGVKVHTIALSDRADHELMQRLAEDTGGWYQKAEQAEELQRAFLRMFETVGKPDAVPLQDNKFVVDSSVKEATVLLFQKPDAPEVVLRSPSGETFKDSDLPGGVAWFRDQGYHLITIDQPQKGEWSLQAEVDPDNRVMIVTDLKLISSEVPTHVVVGESVRVESHLTNRGKLVTRQAFLKLLNVSAQAQNTEGRRELAINDQGEGADQEPQDGRYSVLLLEEVPQEEVELLISVDSPTFVREKRFRLVVHEPLEAKVGEDADGPALFVDAQRGVMRPGGRVTAWQTDAAGQRMPMQVLEAGEGSWIAPMDDPQAPVYVAYAGTSLLGMPIERELGPLMAPGVEPPPPPPEPEPEPKPEPKPAPEPEPEPAEEPLPEEPPEEEADWLIPAIAFGAFNVLLLIGGGVWFFLRRRRGKKDEAELDALLEESAADEPATETGKE